MLRFGLAFVLFFGWAVQAWSLDLIDFIPPEDRAKLPTGIVADEYMAAALDAGDGEIRLPRGVLIFRQALHLKRRVHLIGEGGGLEGPRTTTLRFVGTDHGIVIHRHNTDRGGIVMPDRPADGTIVEGVHLQSEHATGHGIWLRARATIRQTTVDGFGGNCINIVATAKSTDPELHGNANSWVVDTVRLTHCRNGLYIDGADANAGLSLAVSADANRDFGIFDTSFLGNTHIAPHAASNGEGPYRTDDRNGRSVFIGAYSEEGQKPAQFSFPTQVIGGLHGAGIDGTALELVDGQTSSFRVWNRPSAPQSRRLVVRLNEAPESMIDLLVEGDHEHGWSLGWWEEKSKTIQFRYARVDEVALQLTTALSTMLRDGPPTDNVRVGAGQLLMEGAWVRLPSERYRYLRFLDLANENAALRAELAALAVRVKKLEDANGP